MVMVNSQSSIKEGRIPIQVFPVLNAYTNSFGAALAHQDIDFRKLKGTDQNV